MRLSLAGGREQFYHGLRLWPEHYVSFIARGLGRDVVIRFTGKST